MPCIYDYFNNNIKFNKTEVNDLREDITNLHLTCAVENNNLDAIEYCYEKGVRFDEKIIYIVLFNNSYTILSFIRDNINYLDLKNRNYLRFSIRNDKIDVFSYLISEFYEETLEEIYDEIYLIIDEKKINFIDIIFDIFLKNNFNFNFYEYSVKNLNKEIYEYFELLLEKNNKSDDLSKCIKIRKSMGLNDFSNLSNYEEFNNEWLGIENEFNEFDEFISNNVVEEENESNIDIDENENDPNILQQIKDELFLNNNLDNIEEENNSNIDIEENENDSNILQQIKDELFLDNNLDNIEEENDSNINIEENENDSYILQRILDDQFLDNNLDNIEEENDSNIDIEENENDSNILQRILDNIFLENYFNLNNIEEDENIEIEDNENDSIFLQSILIH